MITDQAIGCTNTNSINPFDFTINITEAVGNVYDRIRSSTNGTTSGSYGQPFFTIYMDNFDGGCTTCNSGNNAAYAPGSRINITFTFQYPVIIQNFRVDDVDAADNGNPPGTSSSFQDVVTFSATDKYGNNVPVSISAVAPPSGGIGLSISGQTASALWALGVNRNITPDDPRGQVVATTAVPIKTFTLSYIAGPDDPNPAQQAIRLGEFTICCPVVVDLSGNVFNDLNGLTDNTVNGTGLGNPSSTQLYANLVDPVTGNVVASVPVASNGSYSFTNITGNTNYNVSISTVAGVVDSPPPASGLPSGWYFEGENVGTGTGSDGTPNGLISATVGASDVTNVNFGINSVPESAVNMQPETGNPGGYNSITIPTNAFQTSNVGSNPNTNDANGGAVTSIKITSFPSNANSITINGVIYTNDGTCPPSSSCTPWPASGVVIPYTNGVGSSVPVSVDPVEGNVDVVINFAAIDAAGREDATPGSVTIPFRTVSLSGKVWNDANGNLIQDGSEQNINGTNSGGGLTTGSVLYANLIDPSGNVIATTTVAADGTYSFPNVPATTNNLTVQLTTTAGTVGLPKPATLIPAGWGNVGENKNGQGGSPDNNPNGEILLNTGNSSITQQNFAIERLPDSDTKSYVISQPSLNSSIILNGSGLLPGPLSGSDPEDGTLGAGNPVGITSLPTNNNQLWYNGTQILYGADGINPPSATNPFIINNYNPALLEIRFTGAGSTSTSFTYSFYDAAGLKDPSPATYTISWTGTLPVIFKSIQVRKSGADAILSWEVSLEVNIEKYIVEVSKTGIEPFIPLAEVNTNNQAKYSYTHYNASSFSPRLFYRIKGLENNNRTTYSSVHFLSFNNDTPFDIRPTLIPAGNTFTISMNISIAAADENLLIVIRNADGKVVKKFYIKPGNRIQIPTNNLARGMYLVTVYNHENILSGTKKLVIN